MTTSLLWSLGFSMDGTLVQTPDRTAMLAALERLVLAESPSPDKARCDACADEVAALFAQRAGARATRHRRPDRGDHLEIRVGSGVRPIVLLCHHDTVWPAGTLARLPFLVEGDRVTGPGSYDMKAGIVEAAFALEGAKPSRPVQVCVRLTRAGGGEGIGGAGPGLRPALEGARLRVSGGLDRPPMERGPGTVRLATLAQRLAADLGFRLEETSTGGGSDGNFTAAIGIPTLDGLGPDGGGAHADSEHLLIPTWLQLTELLRRLLDAL